MTRSWRQTLPKAEPVAQAIRAAAPRIETARLILRAPTIADWDALEPIWTTERAKYIGGPFNEETAYLDFCQSVASWMLRGIGAMTIEDKATGAVLGMTGLFLEFGDPELSPEIGWLLVEEAEGKGIAREAAEAVRDLGLQTYGFEEIVSYVAGDNAPSVKLAERIGGVADAAPFTDHDGDQTLIFRHRPRPGSNGINMEITSKSDSENGGQND